MTGEGYLNDLYSSSDTRVTSAAVYYNISILVLYMHPIHCSCSQLPDGDYQICQVGHLFHWQEGIGIEVTAPIRGGNGLCGLLVFWFMALLNLSELDYRNPKGSTMILKPKYMSPFSASTTITGGNPTGLVISSGVS